MAIWNYLDARKFGNGFWASENNGQITWHVDEVCAPVKNVQVTHYVYSQCDRTNVPVETIIFPLFHDLSPETIVKVLTQGWPSHAPFEEYKFWGTNNTWIGCLNHTFKIELI